MLRVIGGDCSEDIIGVSSFAYASDGLRRVIEHKGKEAVKEWGRRRVWCGRGKGGEEGWNEILCSTFT